MNIITGPYPRIRVSVSRISRDLRSLDQLNQLLDYIPHPHFEVPEKEAEILAPIPRAEEYEEKRRAARIPRDVPVELAASYAYPLLDRDQEYHLFRKMNFLKFKAARLRDELHQEGEEQGMAPEGVRDDHLRELKRLLDELKAVREVLINANIRLVVSIARRYVKQKINFLELMSDGTMSLVRAVEKFDCSRGFKLSTYASWAIVKNFARSIPQERHQREHFVTGHEELFDLAPDKSIDAYEAMDNQERASHDINRLLENLDSRERDIIRMRAGLDDHAKGMTLEEIGQHFGITKERVRQLNERAMRKLRSIAQTQKVEL
jgi:RNA polymerase sigma factor (sigma-70 family)